MQGSGVIYEIFNQHGLLLSFFGGLGGGVRAAVLRTQWVETMRVVFVGSATSFSVGVLSPALLRPLVGDITASGSSLGTMCAAAFLMGLVSVIYVEKIIDKQKKEQDDVTRQ